MAERSMALPDWEAAGVPVVDDAEPEDAGVDNPEPDEPGDPGDVWKEKR